jgi:hypothetical protein
MGRVTWHRPNARVYAEIARCRRGTECEGNDAVTTPDTVTSFQPVARTENLARLAALPQRSAFTPELWTRVHDEIQEELARLETEVRGRVSEIRVDAGRTQGNMFFLFSYRTFIAPDSSLDPVVVGITFTPGDQGVAIEADVSGEQTGDWISSLPRKTVANSREALLSAARESARKLCKTADAITFALRDPSRRVD